MVSALVPAFVLLAALAVVKAISPTVALAIAAALVVGPLWLVLRETRPEAATIPAVQPSLPSVPEEVLERLPDPVILLDSGRSIVAANRSARDLLGIGTLGRDLALSLRHPSVLAAVETVYAGVPMIAEEIVLPVPVLRSFTLHAGGLRDIGDPAAPRVVLALHDETRAKKAEQSRADFVANASHELRSPLSSLIGFIETLRGHARDDPEARDHFLAIMHGEASRMARLIDDLLSLARVEINEHVRPRDRINLIDVLQGIADALQVRADDKGMGIELDCPDNLPAATGDADQMTQVFQNLVDNAIKYGRVGTAVRIVARTVPKLVGGDGAGVSVSVIDQGEGIASAHLPRLTERFYRVDEGRSRRLGGTGLGLAIAKHIVNRHKGHLKIESIEGEGSTFTILLPIEGEVAFAETQESESAS